MDDVFKAAQRAIDSIGSPNYDADRARSGFGYGDTSGILHVPKGRAIVAAGVVGVSSLVAGGLLVWAQQSDKCKRSWGK